MSLYHADGSVFLDHYRSLKRPRGAIVNQIDANYTPIHNVKESTEGHSATRRDFVEGLINETKTQSTELADKAVYATRSNYIDPVDCVLFKSDILNINYSTANELMIETTASSSGGILAPAFIVDGQDYTNTAAGWRLLVVYEDNPVLNGIYEFTQNAANANVKYFTRVDYLETQGIPYNLNIPVTNGDIFENTVFTNTTPTSFNINYVGSLDSALNFKIVGADALMFHKIGMADVHVLDANVNGVTTIKTPLTALTLTNPDPNIATVELNATGNLDIATNTTFKSNLSTDHIFVNSYPLSHQGSETPPNPNPNNVEGTQPSLLNGIYFRDPRPYLERYTDPPYAYKTVNDNLCIRVAPVNGVGDTLVLSSFAGISFMTQTNLINEQPKSRLHLKNSGSTALFEVDSTCDISSNDVTGKHFFKTYTTNVLTGDGTYKTNLIPATWDLNPNYTYGFMLYIYSSSPTFGVTKPRAWIEYKTKNYTGPSSTNVLLYSNCTVDSVNTSTPDAYQTIMYVSSTTSKIVGEIQTVSGEYYIGVFKRLY